MLPSRHRRGEHRIPRFSRRAGRREVLESGCRIAEEVVVSGC